MQHRRHELAVTHHLYSRCLAVTCETSSWSQSCGLVNMEALGQVPCRLQGAHHLTFDSSCGQWQALVADAVGESMVCAKLRIPCKVRSFSQHRVQYALVWQRQAYCGGALRCAQHLRTPRVVCQINVLRRRHDRCVSEVLP